MTAPSRVRLLRRLTGVGSHFRVIAGRESDTRGSTRRGKLLRVFVDVAWRAGIAPVRVGEPLDLRAVPEGFELDIARDDSFAEVKNRLQDVLSRGGELQAVTEIDIVLGDGGVLPESEAEEVQEVLWPGFDFAYFVRGRFHSRSLVLELPEALFENEHAAKRIAEWATGFPRNLRQREAGHGPLSPVLEQVVLP